MNRRRFLTGVAAAVAAPYVITTPGLLMPVRKIWTQQLYIIGGWDETTKIATLPWRAVMYVDVQWPRFVCNGNGSYELRWTPSAPLGAAAEQEEGTDKVTAVFTRQSA